MPGGIVPARAAGMILAAVVVAWGLTWPANKVLLKTLSPYWVAAIRSWTAAAALFAIAAVRKDLRLPPAADVTHL